MASNSTNMLLSKVMIAMALVGGIGLLIIDEYVAVDMVQSAGASMEARAPQSPGLFPEKKLISAQSTTATETEEIQLAQSVRGKVGLEPIQIAPPIRSGEEIKDNSPLKELEPAARPRTLDMQPIELLPPDEAGGFDDELGVDPIGSEPLVDEAPEEMEDLDMDVEALKRSLDNPSLNALAPRRLSNPLPEMEMPMPVTLPKPKEAECKREIAVYEARLRARERSLEEAFLALQEEKERILQMQGLVEDRWEVAQGSWESARFFVDRSLEACAGSPPDPMDVEDLELGLEEVDPEVRVAQVVRIVKSMKPKAAARVIERWNNPLAATALSRLSPRVSSKILAQMPEQIARQLTVDMIKGKEHKYQEGNGDGAVAN